MWSHPEDDGDNQPYIGANDSCAARFPAESETAREYGSEERPHAVEQKQVDSAEEVV